MRRGLLIGLLLLTGCMTPQQQSRYQAEQQWRAEHPYEAAQMDALRAQRDAADAAAMEMYGNMFKPSNSYRPPQPQPIPRTRYCNTMNMGGGMYSTNCY